MRLPWRGKPRQLNRAIALQYGNLAGQNVALGEPVSLAGEGRRTERGGPRTGLRPASRQSMTGRAGWSHGGHDRQREGAMRKFVRVAAIIAGVSAASAARAAEIKMLHAGAINELLQAIV